MEFGYDSTYKTARMVSQIISLIGWAVVGLTFLFAFITLRGMGPYGFIGFLLMLAVGVLGGLILVAAGQIVRATVDTADNTGKMLAIMKSKNQ
jgi:hypothetical protein